MKYIQLVDQIIKDAKNKITNHVPDEEEFEKISDYLLLRVNCMLEEIEEELKES